jgi:hypothetical protein
MRERLDDWHGYSIAERRYGFTLNHSGGNPIREDHASTVTTL